MRNDLGQHCWPLTTGAGLVATAVLALVGYLSPVGKPPEWASWVQAVGSIWAILVAVEVANRQVTAARAHAAEQARNETESVLLAIRDEVEVLWEVFQARVGRALMNSPSGTVFNMWWPSPDSPFVIYKANAVVVGRVPNHELRQAIVRAYSRAEGVLVTFRSHNRLLNERKQHSRLVEENPVSALYRRREADATMLLVQYDDQLRTLYKDLEEQIENLLMLLPHRGAHQP